MVQTALSTPDNEEVILPNSVVMSNSIVNRSSMPLCRVQVVVGVDYACDLKAAKAAVLKAATEHPLCVQTQGKEAVNIYYQLGRQCHRNHALGVGRTKPIWARSASG